MELYCDFADRLGKHSLPRLFVLGKVFACKITYLFLTESFVSKCRISLCLKIKKRGNHNAANKNKWLIVLAAIGIHISIGSVYAWSVLTKPIMQSMGFTLQQVTWTFSLAILFLGLSAGFWVVM